MTFEVWDGSAYKLVGEGVFFDVHEHFDPDFLWYSDYAAGDLGNPAVVRRPTSDPKNSTEGWLLVSGAKLEAVGIKAEAEVGGKDSTRSPKWPRNAG